LTRHRCWAPPATPTQVTGTADPIHAFRVTLAWTDRARPDHRRALVNNLDLEVTVGGVTYKGNVFSGANSAAGGTRRTRRTTWSRCSSPRGNGGHFVVTVKATNIAGDGVPGNADTTDQDFALVIFNERPGLGAPRRSASTRPASTSNTSVGTNPPNQFMDLSNTGGGTLTGAPPTRELADHQPDQQQSGAARSPSR